MKLMPLWGIFFKIRVFVMDITSQFFDSAIYRVDMLAPGIKSNCSSCGLPFTSQSGSFTEGAKVTIHGQVNIHYWCPACLACKVRFTESLSLKEELSDSNPMHTTAFAHYSPNHHSLNTVMCFLLNNIIVYSQKDEIESVSTHFNGASEPMTSELAGGIDLALNNYSDHLASIARKLFPDLPADQLTTTQTQRQIGDALKLKKYEGGMNLSGVALFPTQQYLEWLLHPKVRVFDAQEISERIKLKISLKPNAETA